ncbi:MAG: zinc ribbon domain-containing protein [Dehalococcoidia bacterium]|nr:zinc ribbon domain-containing protein [Dehalococcoidia bacterium]MCA9844382.1 zinc ribbon domain-containing protein [Dehalococcoidia bacterium]
MQCPQCSAEVGREADFCRECGAALNAAAPAPTCTSCGASLGPAAAFCRECGTAVVAASPPPPVRQPGRSFASPRVLAAIAAGVVILAGAVVAVVLLAGGGDDSDDIFADPGDVEDSTIASISASLGLLGQPEGETEQDQMRSLMGPPDGFTVTEDVDEAGNVSRREEWFYYEIRTVFEYAGGKLVSSLPLESSYDDFYIAAVQYDPGDFELGVSWDDVAAILPDPAAMIRYELEPEYELDGHFYAGNQLLLFFDDDDRLIYLEALPLAPGEELQ